MGANNITAKCQAAAAAYVRAQPISFIEETEKYIRVREGMPILQDPDGKDIVDLPIVICRCMSADAAVPFEGNWSATLRVELRSNADDEQGEHQTRAAEIFGFFMDSFENMRINLSAAIPDFTAQMVLPVSQGWDLDDRSWVSWLILQVECCGIALEAPPE